ncbi:MAG: ribosomal-processing cysteine protease Prp [Limnochordaceae bacterium]|nr:ribosomal-processing cysteine protease Prp [Limnochordaceae bacterium]
MVRVCFWQDQEGRYWGFEAEGHAGWAATGQDIVCAAISALTQATVIGLQRVARLPVESRQNDEQGVLSCRLQPAGWTSAQGQSAWLLCETLWQALAEIAEQYPKHLRLQKVSVSGDGWPVWPGQRKDAKGTLLAGHCGNRG